MGVDDPDAVERRTLDSVAALSLDGDDRFRAIQVELRGRARPVVGRDFKIQVLPLLPVRIAKALEPDEAAIGEDEAVTDEAAGGCEDRDLRVAKAVLLAELERLVEDRSRIGDADPSGRP